MTYENLIKAVKAHALENYESNGWDYVVECFDNSEIARIIDEAKAETEEAAIKAVGEVAKLLGGARDEVRAEIF
jgi:2',3'-cyclic-nucleotide 2'-phosphodiesterase (5'-nucleotidase family)